MIWHFLEVWFLLALAFAVGCVLGAYLYFVLAETQLAPAQGVFADHVGDVLERVRVRIGAGPVWRRSKPRTVDRSTPRQRPTRPPPPRVEPIVTVPKPALERPETARVLPPPALTEEPPRLRSALLPPPEEEKPPPEIDEDLDPARAASAMAISDDGIVPKRPAGLSAPRAGVPDNLTRIMGVGRRNEQLLNSLGIYHFGQVAAWTPAEVRWIGQYLAFPERIERDDWVGQAIVLASGGATGFEKSAERRRRRRQAKRIETLEAAHRAGVAVPAALTDPTWAEPVEPPLEDEFSDEPGNALQAALAKAAAVERAAILAGEEEGDDDDWSPADESGDAAKPGDSDKG